MARASEGCGAPSGRVLFLVGSLSAPRCGDMLSPFPSLTASSAGSLKLPAEMDPGFPTQAGGRRAPEVVRYTGRETRDHSLSDEVAGPFRGSPQAPHPSPRGGTVPVTHPSWGRDERSVREPHAAGIFGGKARSAP